MQKVILERWLIAESTLWGGSSAKYQPKVTVTDTQQPTILL